jgi:type VI secretion system protein ImpA
LPAIHHQNVEKKKELDPDPEPDDGNGQDADDGDACRTKQLRVKPAGPLSESHSSVPRLSVQGQIVVGMISDTEPHEDALWNNALTSLKKNGIKKALDILFSASCSVSSVRSKNRYRLLMAKLCIQADRHDLARPIAEELNTLVEELGLRALGVPRLGGRCVRRLYRCLMPGRGGQRRLLPG